jgi:phosphonate transport system permease protein
LVLILAVVLLSAAVDALSRRLRRSLRIDALPARLSAGVCGAPTRVGVA